MARPFACRMSHRLQIPRRRRARSHCSTVRNALASISQKPRARAQRLLPTAVRNAIAGIKKNLPPGTTLDIVKDQGVQVTQSVNNVKEALLEGALLTVLVVFLFLNSWRSTVITGLALPVSVLAAFVAVLAAGFTLNTMSLLGLSLAIGILIDDAIVVRENIVRHVEMGEDHLTASHNGTNEIGLAVTATTFSIVAVFVPVAFMGGLSGQWFKPFALTVAAAVMVSLFVSFSLDPMLSAYWPDPHMALRINDDRFFQPCLVGWPWLWLASLPLCSAWRRSLGGTLLILVGLLGLMFPWLDQFNNWFNRTADGIPRSHWLGARSSLVDGDNRRCGICGGDFRTSEVRRLWVRSQ